MCRTQCVLALLALYVGLAHSLSWDVALLRDNQLTFWNNNGMVTQSEDIPAPNIAMMTYDPVHNRMLFLDKQKENITIYSFDLTTKKVQSLVRGPSPFQFIIQSIAYDPVTDLLFIVYYEDIYSLSLKPESNKNNLLIKTNSTYTRDIAVDSCGGFIYWISRHSIYKARMNGSDIETLRNDNKYWLYGLTIDQQTQKIFWIANCFTFKNYEFFIQCADLNGKNLRTLYYKNTVNESYTMLRVSNNYIYWGDFHFYSFWQLPKKLSYTDVDSKPIKTSYWYKNIATNYKTEDQIKGIQNCEALKSLRPNNSGYDSLNVSTDASLLCVHDTKVSGKSVCECAQGYTGERCGGSVCQNYCFRGDCRASDEGQPKCRCNAGYSGERCEVSVCQNYCFQGDCSVSADGQPKCRCNNGYSGDRCEVPVFLTKCFRTVLMLKDILNTDWTPVTVGKGVEVEPSCASTFV